MDFEYDSQPAANGIDLKQEGDLQGLLYGGAQQVVAQQSVKNETGEDEQENDIKQEVVVKQENVGRVRKPMPPVQ